MRTKEERHARLRYWAVISRNRWARKWTRGYAQDFYPEEHDRHLAEIKRDKFHRVLGEFDTAEEAYEAIFKFFESQGCTVDRIAFAQQKNEL
jgi:hypothetical protein